MILPTHIIAVGAIIKNDSGKILLQKNPRRGWEYPGGQVENGENLIDALNREILEEIGVKINIKKIIGIYSNLTSKPGYNGVKIIPTKLMIDFLCEYISGDLILSSENIENGWFSEEEIFEKVTHKTYKTRLKNYFENELGIIYGSYKEENGEYIFSKNVIWNL
jgi:8-oxo-dGTP diphosphatase